jgi:hypothetical protein
MASKSTIRDLKVLLESTEKERDAAKQTLEELDEKIRAVTMTLQMAEAALDEPKDAPPAKEIRNTMVEILREQGTAMHYGELHQGLTARGVEVKGKDPRRNIAAHLSNDDRFRSLGGGIWDLRRRTDPNPMANNPQSGERRVIEFSERNRIAHPRSDSSEVLDWRAQQNAESSNPFEDDEIDSVPF